MQEPNFFIKNSNQPYMIHPNTQIQYINDLIGYGVFATEFIPKGTITYVKDSLELEISPADFHNHSLQMQEQIEKQ